ncbi:MAG: 23S rRNA (uracil(1939)-C(5))-methyltransferase RlmD [Bacteroidales bacterium]
MGRKKLPAYQGVTIEDIAAEGKSLVRVDDVVVFVTGAIPGDVVDLQVIRKRKNYREAKVTRYVKYAEQRVEPFCSHFGICGGCKWQHLPYREQLRYKEKQVLDALTRIGKTAIATIDPIIGSEKTEFYRNKLEYTFSNHRWLSDKEAAGDDLIENRNGLGFHVPGRFDRVVDVDKCYLQDEPSNLIRDTARNFAHKKGLSFYDHRSNEGLLRNLIIRTTTTGELMVVLAVQYDQPVVYEMLDDLSKKVTGITSLMYVVNPKKNETLFDQEIRLYKGRDHIIEEMDGLQFKIGPKSFFQTNTLQALQLYRTAREFAGLKGDETVYDLYTGTGTIANYIASAAGRVIGIESVPEAIDDAVVNAGLNHITNTVFHVGDMKDIFSTGFLAENGSPDVIITDPPRAGMHQDVVVEILKSGAKKIVYVSCNPATQARDVQLLSEGYNVIRSQAVDMFPHTHHIENILLLEKKS